jgi:hypothetical protein
LLLYRLTRERVADARLGGGEKMPHGFGVLDSMLVALPVFLALFGLVRGAPVELASCLGCIAGAIAAWAVGNTVLVQGLSQPWGPLLSLGAGIVTWRLTRGLTRKLGFDTRWTSFGTLLDSVLGFGMGGLRGVAFVSAGCLAYAMIFVPLGLANPIDTVAYPVFLALGSQVTSAVVTAAAPASTQMAINTAQPSLISVPLPLLAPHIGDEPPAPAAQSAPMPAPASLGTVAPATAGVAVASLLHALTSDAVAAPVRPGDRTVAHPVIPVRGVPAWLVETRHNIANPYGAAIRRPRHRP